MDETFVVSSIIDKLPPSSKDDINSLKHKTDDMNVEQLVAYVRIEEGIRVQNEQKDVNPNSSTVNMVEDAKSKETSHYRKKRKGCAGRAALLNKTQPFFLAGPRFL